MQVEKINHGFGGTGAQLKFKNSKVEILRVFAGLVHPSASPGAVVVVAELWKKDKLLDERPLHVLSEKQEQNPSDLMRVAAELAKTCQVEVFLCEDNDSAAMDLVRRQPYRVRMNRAPYLDDENAFETYLLMIRELTAPSRKLLNFGVSRIPGILATIRSDDIRAAGSKTLFERYPTVTALGFCLAGLQTRTAGASQDDMRAQQLYDQYAAHGRA